MMNTPNIWTCCLLIMMARSVLAVDAECRENQAEPNPKATFWDSSKVCGVKQEWQSLLDAYRNSPEKIPGACGKDKYGELQAMVGRLFRRRFSPQDLRELAASCNALPIPIENSGYTKDVLTFMVRSFAESGDREDLVQLLATRCPSYMDWPETIEYYLASRGKKCRDGVSVLGEAYSKSDVPATRGVLAAAIRRGFVELGIRGTDDSDYVANAMKWYEKEKGHLAVSENYTKNETSGCFGVEQYERSPELYDNSRGLTRYPLLERRVSSNPQPGAMHRDRRGEGQAANTGVDTSIKDAATKEIAQLQGAWQATEIVADGKAVPQDKVTEFRLEFENETLRWIGPDGNREELRIRLSSEKAGVIDLFRMPKSALSKEETTPLIYELQEETTLGIYEFEGDILRICLAEPDVSARPTTFKAEEGSRETLFVLKRAAQQSLISLLVASAAAIGAAGVLVRRFVRRRGPRGAAATAEPAPRPPPRRPCGAAR